MSETIVKDYVGQKFGSIEEMCYYYNISIAYFREKSAQGWSVEKILTGKESDGPIKDYKGKTYKSLKEMCKAYDINELLYIKRRACGLSVKDSLRKIIVTRKG